MYHKAYGIIETQAPLHVGASAGEETGNLNLIFRDQFTQTGIIPGSSIRGRFRADMWENSQDQARQWYGHEAIEQKQDGGTTEAIVKIEYASLVWLPIFCPGQPVVWVSCPLLLKRYKQIVGIQSSVPQPYTASAGLQARVIQGVGQNRKVLFFNLGFLEIEHQEDLTPWLPPNSDINPNQLVIVDDNDIATLHDMALYRQSRVKLLEGMKKVDTEKGAFFNVEALPVGSILIFPVALKRLGWQPFGQSTPDTSYCQELYFGGLESIGFGRCQVTLFGHLFNASTSEN